jgi:GLPGLI family protein
MKKIAIIFVSLFFSTMNSQTFEIKYYENKILKNPEKLKELSGVMLDRYKQNYFSNTLVFNDHVSLFKNDVMKEEFSDKKNAVETISVKEVNKYGDTLVYEGKVDKESYKKQNIIYFKNIKNKKMVCEINSNEISYKIIDSLFNWNWQIKEETQIIAGYECRKATSNLMGLNFTAWFTDDLPRNFGPEKYDGLPGTILKVSTEIIEYVAYSVSINKDIVEIKEPVFKDKTYTFLEMLNEEQKRFTKLNSTNSTNHKAGDKIIIKTD